MKDEPLWVSANAELKLDQQIVKVNLTLLLSDEPFQLWQQDGDDGWSYSTRCCLRYLEIPHTPKDNEQQFDCFWVSASSVRWSGRRSTC